MKKLILALAVITSGFASQAETWNLEGTDYTVDTLFHATTGPGITTTGVRVKGTNVFYSTIDLANPDLSFRGVRAKDSHNGASNVNEQAKLANSKGYGTAMVGINGDFFNGSTDNSSCGNCMTDGIIRDICPDPWWLKYATYFTVSNQKDFDIMQNVDLGKVSTFPDGKQHYTQTDLSWRPDNTLCIYTPAFGETTKTNEWGRECQLKLISGSLDGNDAVFEVTSSVIGDLSGNKSHGSMAIPANGYVLSGTGTAYYMMAQLKTGSRISLSAGAVHNNAVMKDVHSVMGGMSYLVIKGEVAEKTYLTLLNDMPRLTGRTAIGYNKDKTKLIMAVADQYTASQLTTSNAEKRSYGATSTGFSTSLMAYAMKALGCYTAMHLDGGGSSQLYNHNFGIRNTPYGADYLRPVACGIFAVSTSPGDNTVADIEVVQKNVKLSSGESLTPKVYAYNKYGVLINTNLTGFKFEVASKLGTVSGIKFTANSTKGATIGVVTYGNAKCGVRIITNGGGSYVTSGDDSAPLQVVPFYNQPGRYLNIKERWHFTNKNIDDGFDFTDPDWSSKDAIKSKSCPRFATGRNGCLYAIDMKTMSIAEYNYTGSFKPLYKLPALTGKYSGVADYYGAAISSDDAGNFLIGHLMTKPESFTVWTIYSPKTGKAKHFTVNRGSELSNGRIDNIGRVVGDLTKDAYVFVSPVATGVIESQHAAMLHFEGNGDVDGVKLTTTFDNGIYMSGRGNANTICQPKYTSAAETKAATPQNSFYWYSKAGGVEQYSITLMTRNNKGEDVFIGSTAWGNYSGLNGFDTFTLAGKRFFALNFATEAESTDNPSGQHLVIMDESGNTVAEWTNNSFKSTAGYNSITAVPVDENNVDIYVYNCTGKYNDQNTGAVAGAMLRVSNGEIKYESPNEGTPVPSGIEEIITDTEDCSDAPVIYYNLQGVQVENPTAGIYIRRQGNKVSKILVK